MLVSTGSVSRQCGMQLRLIDLLCDYGADPNSALHAAALHGELEALRALTGRDGRIDLPVAAALGRIEEASRLLPGSNGEDRHLEFALAAQFGHVEMVRRLLDAGENPNRYNPVGAIPIRRPCIRPLAPAIANSSDYWWNAVRDSIGRISCGRLIRPTGRDTQAGQKSRPICGARWAATRWAARRNK